MGKIRILPLKPLPMKYFPTVASRTSLLFLLIGFAWILTSDQLVEKIGLQLSVSVETLTHAQNVKGLFFVTVVAAGLYFNIKAGEKKLEKSHRGYVDLFQNNPAAMFIFDQSTLNILSANESACAKYGYTEQEMKKLTILDIRPAEEISATKAAIKNNLEGLVDIGDWKHRKKSGELFWVHIYSHRLEYNGVDARMVLVIDKHEELAAKKKIEEHEQKLADLAWIQSHRVRASVARILGLTAMLNNKKLSEEENVNVVKGLESTTKELDATIREIVAAATTTV